MIDEIIAVGDEEFQRRCFDHLYKLRRCRRDDRDRVAHPLGHADHVRPGRVARPRRPPGHRSTGRHGARLPRQGRRRRGARLSEHEGHEVTEAEGASRHGSREIEITHFEVLGADGAPVLMPESGTPTIFRIHYDAHEPMRPPEVRRRLPDRERRRRLGSHDRRRRHRDRARSSGTGHVDCVVDALPFKQGVLLVSLGITDEREMHTYDHLYQAYELRVRQDTGAEDRGLVRLRGRWSSPVPDGTRELLR